MGNSRAGPAPRTGKPARGASCTTSWDSRTSPKRSRSSGTGNTATGSCTATRAPRDPWTAGTTRFAKPSPASPTKPSSFTRTHTTPNPFENRIGQIRPIRFLSGINITANTATGSCTAACAPRVNRGPPGRHPNKIGLLKKKVTRRARITARRAIVRPSRRFSNVQSATKLF